ncbi:hypothetical protein BKA65DRAFT_601935 [Rhexocercosporidium sp. MPI-PUGE-AT-0058]|nr:hypothetical protein BKA65DRAFT_601935 [Rhexocercosporidium sp. MPI-PUGE-AT-0058]
MMYTSLSISSASCVSELAILTTAPSARASSSGKPTMGLSPSSRPTAPTATSKTNGTTPVATVATSIPSSINVLPTTATSFTPSVFPSQMNNTASTTVFGSRTEGWAFWIYLGGVWALSCMIFLV